MVLPITDAAWLMVESRETPQHVGGLMTFCLPEGASDTWVSDLWQRWRRSTAYLPPFSNRLRRPYGRGGIYAWETDPDIDIDYHLRVSALPRPGRVRELLVLASRLHSTLLDRHRPLWEFHLIEGLEGDRFAIYAKFHHSMFDGVGAMRVLRRFVSDDPTVRDMPAPWEISSASDHRGGDVARSGRPPVHAAVLTTARSAGAVVRTLADQWSSTMAGEEGEVMPFSAPRSLVNGRITGSRRFAADGFAFERMSAVAKGFDVSLNDVALAMSGSALRTYLADHGGVPDKPLTAMVPVSIRGLEEEGGGNALSFLVADLGTDLPDAGDRIARIRTSMDKGKSRLEGLTRTERIAYAIAITSPYLLGPLLGFAGRGRPVANVVISNVPGPREPRYYDGATMQGLYPASLLQQGQAINITLASYVDEVQFGLTACRRTMPQMQRMLDHLETGLRELEVIAGV